jgi:RHS repeat-associated protein
LNYEDGLHPQYNGNISDQLWGAGNSLSNTFNYEFDNINRLTKGSNVEMTEMISYDVIGNIESLTRNDTTRKYVYTKGVWLESVEGPEETWNFQYDYNGNSLFDARHNQNVTYNLLNLPATVPGLNLSYVYDASGNKLKKISGTTQTDYIDGIQYTNGSIELIQTDAGIARKNDNDYGYEFNLTDHLGNVRYSFNKSPVTQQLERLQSDDYFPFGLRKSRNPVSLNNKYLCNGKEIQDELGQYDYEARFYDPVIGRFTGVDPLSEKSMRVSPYVYGNNNPIRFIDPDGMEGLDIIYKNRLTNKEVGRTALPGENIVRYTDSKNLAELKANNFDQPQVSATTNTPGTQSAPQSSQSVDYQDVSQATTSLAVVNNVVSAFAGEYAVAKVAPMLKGLFAAKAEVTGALDGSFSVSNWSGYPAGGVKPECPFRLLEGAEYSSSRSLANSTNLAMRKTNPEIFKGLQIHEVHPVKFGGNPTDISNKIFLTPSQHAQYTNF